MTETLPRSAQRHLFAAYGALVLGAAAMGLSPIFVRLAEVGPYASAFWRAALATPLLYVWMRFENKTRASIAPDRMSVLVGILFAGDLFFWHLAILNTSVANATFFATTAPISVAIAAFILFRETIGPRVLAGLMLCILGGSALLGQTYGYAPERLSGDAYGLVTSVFFGLYVLAARVARDSRSAAELTFRSTLVTAIILFVIAIFLEPTLLPKTATGVLALLALALISQVAGQGLLIVALGTLPATFSALVLFLEAIAAAAFGWLILGEALSLIQALGGLLICAGIWIARPGPETMERRDDSRNAK